MVRHRLHDDFARAVFQAHAESGEQHRIDHRADAVFGAREVRTAVDSGSCAGHCAGPVHADRASASAELHSPEVTASATISRLTSPTRSWRNWQTHQLEGLALARAWWFESTRPQTYSKKPINIGLFDDWKEVAASGSEPLGAGGSLKKGLIGNTGNRFLVG